MSKLIAPPEHRQARLSPLGWMIGCLGLSLGLAWAQPTPPGQYPYQLVLETLQDPQMRPLPLGQPQTRTFGEGSSADSDGNPCDVWTLQVQQVQTIRFTVTSAQGDPFLKLFDTPRVFQAQPQAENDDMSGSLDSLLDFKALPGQTYYAMVGVHAEEETPYTYTLMATPFTPPPPQPLPWDTPVEGHLGPQSGSLNGKYCDIWTFAGTEAQVALATLEATQDANLNVFIGPPEDRRTAQKRWNSRWRQRIEIKPGLLYYLAVLAMEGETDYRLHLGPYPPPPLPPMDPLPVPGTVSGELTAEGLTFLDNPCAAWRLDGKEAQRLTLTCSSEEVDPLLAVFDTPDFVLLPDDPSLLEAIATDDDSGGGTSAQLSFDSQAGHTYYVLVMGFGVGPYHLEIEAAPLPPLKKLPLGEVVTSTLTEEREVWELTMPRPGLVTVQMRSQDFDPYLEIKSGRTSSEVLAEDDDSGGGLNAAASFLAEENHSYYIHARGVQTAIEGTIGTYTLEATCVEVPPTQPLTPGIPVQGMASDAPGPTGPFWTFTAPANQRVHIHLNHPDFEASIVVRRGGLTGPVVAVSRHSGGVVFQTEAGMVYHIQVVKQGEPDSLILETMAPPEETTTLPAEEEN